MKVRDWMTKKVISISPSVGIKEIFKILGEKHIGGIPVLDKEKKVLGVVTRDQLLEALLPDYFDMIGDFLFINDFGVLEEELGDLPSLDLFLAEDLMLRNIITVNEDSSLLKIPALMDKYNVNRIPVVDKHNRLVGIVTKADLCQAYFESIRKAGA